MPYYQHERCVLIYCILEAAGGGAFVFAQPKKGWVEFGPDVPLLNCLFNPLSAHLL
jgi:hypothetical protein